MELVVAILAWSAVFVFGLYGWDLLISLAGFLPLPPPPVSDVKRRFAIIVCAHDESRVVAGVIRSLRAQRYPEDRFEIFVVADNCTDDTAAVAEREGATVLVRHNETQRTKGYALQWGRDRVIERGPFDALCVFDADNLMTENFLSVMNDYLGAGHMAIQAYLDTKNPDESWVTRSIALAYLITNRFWFRARQRAGLSTTLGGTGFCVAWNIILEYPWDPGSLADDLELTMELIHSGVPVTYCPHARTYDEKPTTLRQSFRQRARWMGGHNDVAFRYSGRMIWAALTRISGRCFDAALHLLQPLRMVLAFFLLVFLVIARLGWPEVVALEEAFRFTFASWAVPLLIFGVYPILIAVAERAKLSLLANMPAFLLFGFSWIPAILLGLVRVRKRVWVHTAHGP